MTAEGVARDARVLLSRGWTQPTSDRREDQVRARLDDGTPCSHLNAAARRFTLSGALLRATNDEGTDGVARHPAATAVYAALKKHLGEEPSAWANSAGRWQHDVVEALDAVIELLGKEAA